MTSILSNLASSISTSTGRSAQTSRPKAESEITPQALTDEVIKKAMAIFGASGDYDQRRQYIRDTWADAGVFYSHHDKYPFKLDLFLAATQELLQAGIMDEAIDWARETYKDVRLDSVAWQFFPKPATRRQVKRGNRIQTYDNPARSGLYMWLLTCRVNEGSSNRPVAFSVPQTDTGVVPEASLAARYYLRLPVGQKQPILIDPQVVTYSTQQFDPELAEQLMDRKPGDLLPSGNFGQTHDIEPEQVDSPESMQAIRQFQAPDIDAMDCDAFEQFVLGICSTPPNRSSQFEGLLQNLQKSGKLRDETAQHEFERWNAACAASRMLLHAIMDDKQELDDSDHAAIYAAYIDSLA